MGARVAEPSQDSLPMRRFLNKWFDTLVEFPAGSPRTGQRVLADFHEAMAAHRRGVSGPDARWGWKNPRNMWLIPFYLTVFPQLKMVHVIRDGRDMSLSTNVRLLVRHGRHLLGRNWKNNPQAAQMTLWASGNLRAAEAARLCAPGHYFLLRYEDMCASPQQTVGELYKFLGASSALVSRAAEEIRPSSGISRGRGLSRADADRIDPSFWRALETFGYS